MANQITIALTKGRILKETLPILAAADIHPLEDIARSRKLCFDTNHDHIRLIILRGADVATYVRFGTADIGVVGKDMLLEQGLELKKRCDDQGLYELLDLGIARCKLMTAGPVGKQTEKKRRIRVATKFNQIAEAYYAQQGVQADIIKLYGAMELAPVLGLADEIIDIVDTGNTLKANGLAAWNVIADISSRLVANKASMKMKYKSIQSIVAKIQPYCEMS